MAKPLTLSQGITKELPANTKLDSNPGTTTAASFAIPHGVAPTNPVNGDFWTTTASLLGYINGATRTFIHSGNPTTLASDVAQAEAEAGTATTRRWWTAQMVRYNVAAYAYSKAYVNALEDRIALLETRVKSLEANATPVREVPQTIVIV